MGLPESKKPADAGFATLAMAAMAAVEADSWALAVFSACA